MKKKVDSLKTEFVKDAFLVHFENPQIVQISIFKKFMFGIEIYAACETVMRQSRCEWPIREPPNG